MKHLAVIAVAAMLLAPSVARGECAAGPLTEQTIREHYIERPDSCLHLLDSAEAGRLASDIAPFRFDILRAMCYEIRGDYAAKGACVRRAMERDSVRLVPARLLAAKVMLAEVLERQGDYEAAIGVCGEAVELARSLGKKRQEADMLSTMARIYAGMSRPDEALESFRLAIGLLEGTADVREMSCLSTIYGEYMTTLIDLGRKDEAIETGRRREAVIARMSALPGPPPGYIDQQYGFLYAKMALLLHDAGNAAEAAAVYARYCGLYFSHTSTGKQFAIPYLLAAGRYAEALGNNDSCLAAFANDTVSYAYLGLLQNEALAYRGLHRYELADWYMRRCYALQDSIYAREKESDAQHYAELFATKEKELQLHDATALSQRMVIVAVAASAFAIMLAALLWVLWASLNRTRRRNRIDARRIDELLEQKSELRKLYRAEAIDEMAAKAPAAGADDEAYTEFMRMESVIVSRRLFLDPKFGRDDLLRATGIGKNDLVPLLRKYAGSVNLSDYINRLRLEYAVRLMKEHRNHTIDSIAEASGFNSRSTFYRAFLKIWGMTPTQYLQTQDTSRNVSPD